MCEPLTPPECDLRGMECLPFNVPYWRDCSFTLGTTDEEFRAGMMLAWASWHQTPAASLPDDDILLMAMCGWGRKAPLDDWKRIKTGVLRDWLLCSDGRYYHPVIAEEALSAWQSRSRARGLRVVGDAATPLNRVQKLRHEHKTLRIALQQFYGITMRSTAAIDAVREAIGNARQQHPDVASTERLVTEEAIALSDISQGAAQSESVAVPKVVSRSRPAAASKAGETSVFLPQEIATGRTMPPQSGPCLANQGLPNVQGDDSMDLVVLDEPQDLLAGLIPSLPGTEPSKKNSVPSCPVERFVKLYEDNMPNNPKVRLISDFRRRKIRDIWKWASTKGDIRPFLRYKTTEEGLLAWDRFFAVCGRIDFLIGNAAPRKPESLPWVADIDFFTRPDVVIKCIEGKYGDPKDEGE